MDGSGGRGNKVVARLTEPAPRPSDGELLGALEDAWRPTDTPKSSRRHRQILAHVGLPDGYHGAAGPLLAGLEIDLGRLRAAAAAKLRGSQR